MKRSAVLLALVAIPTGCTTAPLEPAESRVEPAGITMGTWRRVDAATSRLTDIDALGELARQFPDSAAVQVRYFNALVGAGQAPQAYSLLDRISARGYRFSSNGERQINAFFAANGYPKPLSLTLRPGDVAVASTVAATVPATIHLAEAALRERASGRIYITSIVSRGLFRQDGRGGWERVELGPTGSLGGIVQAADGTIWVSSAAYESTPEAAAAYRGLIGIRPTGGTERRIDAPAGTTPSDIALAPDGTLFAADPLTGAIYRARPGASALETLVAPGTFRSAQGLAVSGDGRFLYVSDYGYGLAMVDLGTGRVDRLPAPNSLFVDGTDGLWLHDGELIAVQNGARPARIVAHRLSADGRSITDTRRLESAHPDWTEPGSGSIDGDALLYIATGQWDRFAASGAPVEGKPPLPTDVRVLSLAEKPAPPPKKPS